MFGGRSCHSAIKYFEVFIKMDILHVLQKFSFGYEILYSELKSIVRAEAEVAYVLK